MNSESKSESLQSYLLAGHLGHLTSVQQQAFSIFKDNLEKADLYTPLADSANVNSRASHDEPTLLLVICLRGDSLSNFYIRLKGGFSVLDDLT